MKGRPAIDRAPAGADGTAKPGERSLIRWQARQTAYRLRSSASSAMDHALRRPHPPSRLDPRFPEFWIAFGVEDCKYHNSPGSDAIEHRVGKLADQSLTDIPMDYSMKFGHRRDSVENGLYAFGELDSESRPLLLIPIERLVELSAGFWSQNNRESHHRARFKASALTSSQDTTSSGAASSAARRRSSSSLKSSQISGS